MNDFETTLQNIEAAISGWLTDYIMVTLLLVAAVWFTLRLRFAQVTMLGSMLRTLVQSGSGHRKGSVSSFQAFALSIASRVGTGNLAGVATAIVVGGPGAVFWMWVIAILGAASAFVECTLAQLFKVRAADGTFAGGPAYYIQKGLGQRWWAVLFAVLITLTFGLAFNSVQSNTMSAALNTAFGIPEAGTAVVLAVLTGLAICGGVHRIGRISQWVVPFMAIGYIVLAIVIVCMNIHRLPDVMTLIVENAFGVNQALGGTMGAAMIMGVKRGLFSNEAGEGSTPNAAAVADVSHPVKQGLLQTLGVYVDTLLICTATAMVILCSGVSIGGQYDGIELTQRAVDASLGGSLGSVFVGIAIVLFAFTSIIANYYYGETNLRFINRGRGRVMIGVYRLVVVLIVYAGALTSLGVVWGFADITMALMTVCNLVAIVMLGRYAVALLRDYRRQQREGKDPQYHRGTLPSIKDETECWPD